MRSFLANEIVTLRPLTVEDLNGGYPHWFDSEEVCRGNNHHRFPLTLRQLEAYIENANSDRSQLVLAIVDRITGIHVGNIALSGIDWINRSAELTIVIGEHNQWHKGYGYSACRLVVEHAFKSLQLHRIGMGTFSSNIGMQKIGEKLGFKREGIRRQAAFKNAQYIDIIEYGLLREEYAFSVEA